MVHGRFPCLDYRHPVGTPRLLRVANVGLVVLAAACVPAAASPAALPSHLTIANALVLRLDDVTSGATMSVDTALTADDAAASLGITGLTGDAFTQNGFVGGYGRAFVWRDASLAIPRLMASTTYLFADPVGAHDMLSHVARAADEIGMDRMSVGVSLGDESAGLQLDGTFTNPLGTAISVTTTAVLFRHANALSLVSSLATSDADDPGYVIALARRQLGRQRAVAQAGVPVPALVAAPRVEQYGTTHSLASPLLLTIKDVPAGMRVRNEAALTALEFAAGSTQTAELFDQHGFVSAYSRVFTHQSAFGKEATLVRSQTAIFKDSAGAHEAYLDYRDFAKRVGARKLGAADAGDESLVFRLDDFEADTSYVEVLFLHRNAVSLVEVRFPVRLANESLTADLAKAQASYQLADLGLLKPLR